MRGKTKLLATVDGPGFDRPVTVKLRRLAGSRGSLVELEFRPMCSRSPVRLRLDILAREMVKSSTPDQVPAVLVPAKVALIADQPTLFLTLPGEDRFRQEGNQARLDGADRSDCPYPSDSDGAFGWLRGFDAEDGGDL